MIAFTVTDYDGHGVPARRLAAVLGDLEALYTTVANGFGLDVDGPRVLYADSGSDVTVGLQGLKGAIEAIGDLFRRAWEVIRYRDNDRFERNLRSADIGIEFVAKLRARVTAAELDPETARHLEAAANQQMGRLLGAGVMLETVEEVQHFDRRAALERVRDIRLLGPGISGGTEPDGGVSGSSGA